MYIKCVITNSPAKPQGLTPVGALSAGRSVYMNIEEAAYVLKFKNDRVIYIFGQVFYIWNKTNDTVKKVISVKQLSAIFDAQPLNDVIAGVEGQYIGVEVDGRKGAVRFFSDRYAREDSFYTAVDGNFYLGADLDLIFKYIAPQYDQRMLAHLFSVYGWYTPKGLTIYKNVFQLKVGETLTVSNKGVTSAVMDFKPLPIKDYGEKDLQRYYQTLSDSIETRLPRNKKDVWVSSSSGWDSSVILGMLVDKLGSKRVKMMTGSMQYSGKTGLINRFEIDKIKAIGGFYGIKPNTVNLDFKNKSAIGFWKKITPNMKSKQMYSLTGFNFSRIAHAIADIDGQDQVVFNGETSDSFHNFGFSQFATFFHTVKSFTEYGDKMNCYLYGPTFFKKVINGEHEKDKVFQIFTKMMPSVTFDNQWPNRAKQLESYLLPLFYGGPRVPFARTMDNPILNQAAAQSITTFPFGEYMPQIIKGMNDKNMYSWIIYMYASLHAQGSTVGMQKHAMHASGHEWRAVFNDYRVIDLLSSAPESWGRGLDFNHTKYPLKWAAKNKIKFPYELLEQGPHSYLYDVMEGFSLIAEIMYRSGFTGYYKEILQTRGYRQIFDGAYFNMPYMDRLVDDYLSGKEAKGSDFNNLFTLITLTSVGLY